MAEALRQPAKERPRTNFRSFKNIGANEVTCIAYNDLENRLAIASVDHKFRVYEYRNSEWNFVEKWRGHDAEVLDASHFES